MGKSCRDNLEVGAEENIKEIEGQGLRRGARRENENRGEKRG